MRLDLFPHVVCVIVGEEALAQLRTIQAVEAGPDTWRRLPYLNGVPVILDSALDPLDAFAEYSDGSIVSLRTVRDEPV